MKVLWLAQLPYIKNPTEHPVPWIGALAKHLSKNVKLTIVSANSKIEANDEFLIDGISYKYVKLQRASFNLLSLNTLNSRIIKNYLQEILPAYDVLHIHGSEYQFQQACVNLNIPKVLSIQGIINEYYKYIPEVLSIRRILWWMTKQSEKRYLPQIKNFMCRTDWDKAWVSKHCPNSSIHHCWECLRDDFFVNEINSVGKNKIIFLGGTNDIKGYKEALLAFNKALNKIPSLELIFVSSNRERDTKIIRDFLIDKNLGNITTNNLIFKGRLSASEMIEEYKNCFCLLHPSYIDNSPNTICEAQVTGLPVIASNVGGVSSLIDHNQTGILTGLNIDELSDAIVKLHSDKHMQEVLSKQAKLIARERHNTIDIVNKTIEIYYQISNMEISLTAADEMRI